MTGRIKLKHERLASALRRSRLSQNHWALRMGLDRGHLSQLVRGKRPYPSTKTRRKLLDALELDHDALFELEEPRPKPGSAPTPGRPLFRVLGPRRPFVERQETTMEAVIRDFRHALRRLARSPGFTLLAVLPLAVGIGANSTIFSFVNAALLATLPVERPEEVRRLVVVSADGARTGRLSYADYEDYRDRSEVFSDLMAVSLVPLTWAAGEKSDQVLGEVVSGNFFPAFGIRTVLGRPLLLADDEAGSERAAVISYPFWQRRFGADPAVLGRKVLLGGDPFTVVGVASGEFTGTFVGVAVDVWTPIAASGNWFGPGWRHDRGRERFQAFGRLRPAYTTAQATAALDQLAAALGDELGEHHRGRRIELSPATLLAGNLRRALSLFLGVVTVMVGLVLLLACANIAHLLLARAIDRRQETAIRLAMGAGRFRLGRQFLTESVVLALLGGAAGFFLALWSAHLLSRWDPVRFVPLRVDVMPDVRVFGFTLAVSLVTGAALGLIPVLQAGRRDLVPALKGGDTTADSRPRKARWRGVFLMTQIALSLVLLVTAALFLESLSRIRHADPGFDTDDTLAMMDLDLEVAGLAEAEGRRFFHELPRRLETLPGVESVTLADLAPLDLATARRSIEIPGHTPTDPTGAGQPGLRLSMNRITPGYFHTLGIPLLAGREFDHRDNDDSQAVAIVNETLARRFWPGEDPLGQHLRLGGSGEMNETRTVAVVGLARDVKYRTFAEEATAHFYLPLEQDYSQSMTLLVRTAGEARPMIATLQQELVRINGDVQGFFSRTLPDHLGFAMLPARVAAVLFALFGGVALTLAMVGIYGAVAYSVAGRTRELGVRVALGAGNTDVIRLVLKETLTVAAAGLAVGLTLALVLGRLLASLLFGVSASDPGILAAVAAGVLAVVLVASYPPARRATRVDPLLALRQE